MMTEAYIKSQLDGTFTTWDHIREAWRTIKVPLDHIPKHKPAYFVDQTNEPRGTEIQWTPAMDDMVFELRNAGNIWTVVAKHLDLSPQTCILRYIEICRQRGVEPLSNEVTAPRKFSREKERAVMKMRAAGMTFAEIGRAIGVTTRQANDIHIRCVQRESKRGLAA